MPSPAVLSRAPLPTPGVDPSGLRLRGVGLAGASAAAGPPGWPHCNLGNGALRFHLCPGFTCDPGATDGYNSFELEDGVTPNEDALWGLDVFNSCLNPLPRPVFRIESAGNVRRKGNAGIAAPPCEPVAVPSPKPSVTHITRPWPTITPKSMIAIFKPLLWFIRLL